MPSQNELSKMEQINYKQIKLMKSIYDDSYDDAELFIGNKGGKKYNNSYEEENSFHKNNNYVLKEGFKLKNAEEDLLKSINKSIDSKMSNSDNDILKDVFSLIMVIGLTQFSWKNIIHKTTGAVDTTGFDKLIIVPIFNKIIENLKLLIKAADTAKNAYNAYKMGNGKMFGGTDKDYNLKKMSDGLANVGNIDADVTKNLANVGNIDADVTKNLANVGNIGADVTKNLANVGNIGADVTKNLANMGNMGAGMPNMANMGAGMPNMGAGMANMANMGAGMPNMANMANMGNMGAGMPNMANMANMGAGMPNIGASLGVGLVNNILNTDDIDMFDIKKWSQDQKVTFWIILYIPLFLLSRFIIDNFSKVIGWFYNVKWVDIFNFIIFGKGSGDNLFPELGLYNPPKNPWLIIVFSVYFVYLACKVFIDYMNFWTQIPVFFLIFLCIWFGAVLFPFLNICSFIFFVITAAYTLLMPYNFYRDNGKWFPHSFMDTLDKELPGDENKSTKIFIDVTYRIFIFISAIIFIYKSFKLSSNKLKTTYASISIFFTLIWLAFTWKDFSKPADIVP
jgi:hypothetical protein